MNGGGGLRFFHNLSDRTNRKIREIFRMLSSPSTTFMRACVRTNRKIREIFRMLSSPSTKKVRFTGRNRELGCVGRIFGDSESNDSTCKIGIVTAENEPSKLMFLCFLIRVIPNVLMCSHHNFRSLRETLPTQRWRRERRKFTG